MSLKKQIEEALFADEKSLNATLCVIKAIYKLSFNHYLQVNGFTENDLKNKDGGLYRQLTTWPSQSRFIFSLEQMRDAYERLGNSSIATDIMSEDQIEESRKRKKSKEGFWTILGEAEDSFQSFRVLEDDINYGKEKLQSLRVLSYAFRLVLFQTKISEFRETGNFLALLKSANKELARAAFQDCAGIVPLPRGFFSEEGISDENECSSLVTLLRKEIDEKDRLLVQYRENLQETNRKISATLNEMQETKVFTNDLIVMLQNAFATHQNFCKEIEFQKTLPTSQRTKNQSI